MNDRTTRITRTVIVAVAGVVAGLAATIAIADDGGSGRDPGSYHPAEREAIAEWAADHQMSGLSPASLSTTESSDYSWTPRLAAEMRAIAEYAREHELSGLSPASLRPLDATP